MTRCQTQGRRWRTASALLISTVASTSPDPEGGGEFQGGELGDLRRPVTAQLPQLLRPGHHPVLIHLGVEVCEVSGELEFPGGGFPLDPAHGAELLQRRHRVSGQLLRSQTTSGQGGVHGHVCPFRHRPG